MRVGCRVANDELVLGRAARVLAGLGGQRAMGGQPGFAAPDGLFVELGLGEIVVDLSGGGQSGRVNSAGRIAFADLVHSCSPCATNLSLRSAAETARPQRHFIEAETEKPSDFKSLIDLKILKSFKSFNVGRITAWRTTGGGRVAQTQYVARFAQLRGGD